MCRFTKRAAGGAQSQREVPVNAGFSNLTTLKAYLLASSLRNGTTYDSAITSIGLGVAAAFANFCNRKFDRVVNATEVFDADRCQFLLSRFPVEAPVAQVEFKADEPTGWIVQQPGVANNLTIRSVDTAAGIIYFPDNADCGDYWSQLRFTFTGGFFWETKEPTDMGYPTEQPAASAALPADLLSAWLIQCEIVWKMRDKLGTQIVGDEQKGRGPLYAINDLDLAPQVKQMLAQFMRIQMV